VHQPRDCESQFWKARTALGLTACPLAPAKSGPGRSCGLDRDRVFHVEHRHLQPPPLPKPGCCRCLTRPWGRRLGSRSAHVAPRQAAAACQSQTRPPPPGTHRPGRPAIRPHWFPRCSRCRRAAFSFPPLSLADSKLAASIAGWSGHSSQKHQLIRSTGSHRSTWNSATLATSQEPVLDDLPLCS
jgi:hypothetical protein